MSPIITLRIIRWRTLFILLFICCGVGCSQFQKSPDFGRKSSLYDADKVTLKKGNKAFRNGDYQEALEVYGLLSQLAEKEETRRKALYGLACTRMILSENKKDLDEAVTLWEAWSKLVPTEITDEDPRMLEPLLPGRAFPEKNLNNMNSGGKKGSDSEILKARENKILQLQKQIKTMENEIETLRHQINSLEEIDQNIFEKKKDISTNSH